MPDHGMDLATGPQLLIGYPDSGITLRRTGANTTGAGIPCTITVRARELSGTFDRKLNAVEEFIEDMRALHSSLAGQAILDSFEGFRLTLAACGLGQIRAGVDISSDHDGHAMHLSFGFDIDQSYLPALISRLEHEFV